VLTAHSNAAVRTAQDAVETTASVLVDLDLPVNIANDVRSLLSNSILCNLIKTSITRSTCKQQQECYI